MHPHSERSVMRYKKLGTSGLEISEVALGMMSFGESATGAHTWTLSLDESRELIRLALESGITTFDTANIYSGGSSEEVTGTILKELAQRESVQIATKAYNPMRQGPNTLGLSRAALFTEIDASLRRLQTDYVDLYQIHAFDPTTPMEETMEALNDIVRSGKARYIGASNLSAWQFSEIQNIAERHGWAKFISAQSQYNLLAREIERELVPYVQHAGVGVIPWSPQARGRLTRPWGSAATNREQNDIFGSTLYSSTEESNAAIVSAVSTVAEDRGVSMAQIALAWVSNKSYVSAPIVGATKPRHIEDAIAAVEIALTDDEVAALEAAYTPRNPF